MSAGMPPGCVDLVGRGLGLPLPWSPSQTGQGTGFSALMQVRRGDSELTSRRGKMTDIFLYIYTDGVCSLQRCFLINKEIT